MVHSGTQGLGWRKGSKPSIQETVLALPYPPMDWDITTGHKLPHAPCLCTYTYYIWLLTKLVNPGRALLNSTKWDRA